MLAMLMMVVMLIVVMAAAAVLAMLMMLVSHLLQLRCDRILPLHGLQQLCAGKILPGSRYHRCIGIVLPQQRNGCIQLCLGNHIRTGKDDRFGGFDLIVIELAEILHIHLDLAGINHSDGTAQRNCIIGHLFHSCDHIGKLANAGGLDDDPIRSILIDHLGQSLAKITHQGAANTAGIHLGNVNAGILQKSAVNANLTKFVFDQHQFFPLISLRDHFFDQCCLAGAQKAGINIDFHGKHLPIHNFLCIIPPCTMVRKSNFHEVSTQSPCKYHSVWLIVETRRAIPTCDTPTAAVPALPRDGGYYFYDTGIKSI